ncbi:MAG: type II secretion system protein [Victivallales bacterium]
MKIKNLLTSILSPPQATGYYERPPLSFNGSEILYNIKKSFTLIELLVVIAIIGILFGLVAPALNKVKQKANSTKCVNNLHNIALAFQGYLLSSNDIMPVAARMPSLNLNTDPRIVDVLASEIQNNTAVFQCPSDTALADAGKTYFAAEGTSYDYSDGLGGRKLGKSNSGRDTSSNLATTLVMFDYTWFHGAQGTPGAINCIWGDWHIE